MKKFVVVILTALLTSVQASAQDKEDGAWTLNTRLWSSNYFTSLIYDAITVGIKSTCFKGHEKDSMLFARILPTSDWVFPIGMGKRGFDDPLDIYGPYHRAFSNPIKHIGDYAIGFDASYKPSLFGIYAGAYFKSQEICFKESKDNLRGFYIQPRAGFVLGKENTFEAGVFYDIVTGCGGSIADTDKGRLKGGLGLDFAIGNRSKNGKTVSLLQFSMPLHNFLDDSYPGQDGMKRKVGYILLTQRFAL
jgi:hypothetical protein